MSQTNYEINKPFNFTPNAEIEKLRTAVERFNRTIRPTQPKPQANLLREAIRDRVHFRASHGGLKVGRYAF